MFDRALVFGLVIPDACVRRQRGGRLNFILRSKQLVDCVVRRNRVGCHRAPFLGRRLERNAPIICERPAVVNHSYPDAGGFWKRLNSTTPLQKNLPCIAKLCTGKRLSDAVRCRLAFSALLMPAMDSFRCAQVSSSIFASG